MMDGQGGSYLRNPDGSLTLVSRTQGTKPQTGLTEETADTLRAVVTGTRKPKKETDNG